MGLLPLPISPDFPEMGLLPLPTSPDSPEMVLPLFPKSLASPKLNLQTCQANQNAMELQKHRITSALFNLRTMQSAMPRHEPNGALL